LLGRDEFKLCQLQGNKVGFLLSLRTKFFQWITTNFEYQIIFMNPGSRMLAAAVLVEVQIQQCRKRMLVELRMIRQLHNFLTSANPFVQPLKNGHKGIEEVATRFVQIRSGFYQLLIPDIQPSHVKSSVFPEKFEQTIALNKGFVVADQTLQVNRIELRNNSVDELATDIAAFVYQILIIRRNNYHRITPDVFAELIVFLSFAPEHFLLSAFHSAVHGINMVTGIEFPLNHEKRFVVPDVLAVNRVEVTLAMIQIIYGIQHIGFSGTILPYQAVNAGFKMVFC